MAKVVGTLKNHPWTELPWLTSLAKQGPARTFCVVYIKAPRGGQPSLIGSFVYLRTLSMPSFLLGSLPGPSPTPKPSTVHQASTPILNSVLVGAVIGGVATVLAELVAKIIGNYRSYRFILSTIREEVSEIGRQVDKRKGHLDLMIPLYENFPMKAWETLLQSQQRRYMSDKRRGALNSLYQAVSIANEHLGLIPTVLQISQLATSQSVKDTYREETLRLLKAPLAAVEAALPQARQALKVSQATTGSPVATSGGAK